VRHADREFNKMRFLVNCEAAYKNLLDGPDGTPCSWIIHQVWGRTAKMPGVADIEGLPPDLSFIPGRPFWQEEQYDRRPVPTVNPIVRLGK
jgi:hypothetical protein